MGINSHYYTVYGVHHTGYNSDLSEVCYDRGFDIIMDSMGGKYFIIGKTLFDSGDLRWGDVKDVFVEISINDLEKIREEYSEKFSEVLPEFKNLLEGEWKLMTFVHYS